MLRVNEVINPIRGLGEKVEESMIMKKVLCSLPQRFNSKVLVIEEAKDLNAFSMDEIHGSLTTYEMRIGKSKATDRKATFKVNKNIKEK